MERKAAQRLVDLGLVGALAAVGVVEIWVPFPSVLGEGSRALTTAIVLLTTGLLAFRRRWPLPTALAVLWLWPLVFVWEPLLVLFWGQFVPMVAAVFSVARFGRGREPWLGAGAGAATLLYFDLRVEPLQSPAEIVFHWMVFTLAWCCGWGLRAYEQRARRSTERAIAVEVAAAEQAMAAVLAERTRIARELHDIVAHSVTVMVVQAGAAEQVVDDDPEFVRRALSTVRTTGTTALADMRRVLTMLRDSDEPGSLAPQPGVAAVASLVEQARFTGLDATLAVEGAARPLPPGLDLTAYRVVQEALTNVRKHAQARRASVVLRYTDAEMHLEVSDDGVGGAGVGGAGDGGAGDGDLHRGHGLIGMRERVGLYGGQLDAVPGSAGGFTVHARLPLSSP